MRHNARLDWTAQPMTYDPDLGRNVPVDSQDQGFCWAAVTQLTAQERLRSYGRTDAQMIVAVTLDKIPDGLSRVKVDNTLYKIVDRQSTYHKTILTCEEVRPDG